MENEVDREETKGTMEEQKKTSRPSFLRV